MGSRPERRKERRVEERREDRRSARHRGYTWAWEKAREVYLSEHPLCVECEKNGIVFAGSKENPICVDHIVPHQGDMDLFWEEENWQTLCKTHHDQKTARGE